MHLFSPPSFEKNDEQYNKKKRNTEKKNERVLEEIQFLILD